MNRRTIQLATALAAAAALAACSGGSEDAAPAENAVNAMELTEDLPADENIAEPAPVVTENATTPAPVAEPAQPDEAQIQDDAEAVGMTARVQRGDTSGNQAAPAE